MELLSYQAEFFKKGDADGFDVAGLARIGTIRVRDGIAAQARIDDVQTHGRFPGRKKVPFGRAEKNTDAAVRDRKDDGRARMGFDMMFDCADYDAVLGNVDEHAA